MFRTVAFASVLFAPFAVQAQDVVRHNIPDSDFPIALAVEVPAGATTVYLSGAVPEPADPDADPTTAEAWGDMETQTISVLNSIDALLHDIGLTMGDVVKMQAYLVAPAGGGEADFAGFMRGYSQFFGTEDQPDLPARSAMIVDALVDPNWLIEIEVTAARP